MILPELIIIKRRWKLGDEYQEYHKAISSKNVNRKDSYLIGLKWVEKKNTLRSPG